MSSLNSIFTRFTLALSIGLLLVTGCSNSNTGDDSSATETDVTDSDEAALAANDDTANGTDSSDPEQNASNNVPETESSIRSDNYLDILRAAVDATNVLLLTEDIKRVGELIGKVRAAHGSSTLGDYGLTLISEEMGSIDGDSPHKRQYNFNCDAGGSLVFEYLRQGGVEWGNSYSFNDCFIGDDLYDGNYSSPSVRSVEKIFDNFSAQFADGSSFSIDGRYSASETKFPVKSQAWEEFNFIKTDSAGIEFKQLDFNKHEFVVSSFRDVDAETSYVALADGNVGIAVRSENNASLLVSFELEMSKLEAQQFTVFSNLYFDGDFLRWEKPDISAPENFVEPDFPVSDLGNPLMVERRPYGSGNMVLETNPPQVPKGSEQWNAGSLFVVAEDGSWVVMRPSVSIIGMVNISLSDNSYAKNEVWSDGLQVKCPYTITGC